MDAPKNCNGHTPAKRALVVDDNRDLATLLKLILKKRGWDVRLSFDGPTAIATALEHRPNVVLLDLSLPELDGREVAAQLRANQDLKSCCIVATSGWDADRQPAGNLFDHYLVKPIDHDKLNRILENVPLGE